NKGPGRRIVVVSRAAPADRVRALAEKAEIVVAGEAEVDLPAAVAELKRLRIDRLMVEGGATLNYAMMSQRLVDELSVFVGNLIIGGKDAPTLMDGAGIAERTEAIELKLVKCEPMDEGIVLTWKVL
ncbi:MAG TPA: dihydrofolate reductase family protein, partial [Methanocella sp.]|nr:dihydrofolate reductase family protein [Methanocella sp.]